MKKYLIDWVRSLKDWDGVDEAVIYALEEFASFYEKLDEGAKLIVAEELQTKVEEIVEEFEDLSSQ